MPTDRSTRERKEFLICHWNEWFPTAEIEWRSNAPDAPTEKGDYLDHLGQWVKSVEWPDSDVPELVRCGEGFVLRRGENNDDSRRKNIYTALQTVLWVMLSKSAAEKAHNRVF